MLLLDLLQEHQGGAASGPFAINPGLIIWTLIVFGILLVLLWRLAFPAIVRSVEERETLLAKAREEYDALLTRARQDIDAEKEKAILALRREAVDLSIAAASRVIEANLDTDANRRLVSDFLESLGKAEKKK